jgi:hypothetical protein
MIDVAREVVPERLGIAVISDRSIDGISDVNLSA